MAIERRNIGPLKLHPNVRLTGLTRAHTAALVAAATNAGEFVTTDERTGRWAITTPEKSYVGGSTTTCVLVFGEAWESPVQWLDRHLDRYPANHRIGRLLRTVRRRLIGIPLRGGPKLDRGAEEDYWREQADYG